VTMSRALSLTVVPALVGVGLAVVAPATASAASLSATLVNTVNTSAWAKPSPDPSGITYNSDTGQLIISDAEVDELPLLYKGENLFRSTLAGAQLSPGGTSLPWSAEPTGVAYRASDDTLFASDDDQDLIFQVAPGADGIHGTPDDGPVTSFTTAATGNFDPEDVAIDLEVTREGSLLVIDGKNKEVFEYAPGTDRRLGTGDDQVSHFDVRVAGALDPEGIAYHQGRGTLLVLDQDSRTIYEYNRSARLLNRISIAAANSVKAAGLAVAPASNGSGALNLYIVDRGVDNNEVRNENDGKYYEMAVSLPPVDAGQEIPGNNAPLVSAGVDTSVALPGPASLQGSVEDDGLPAGSTVTTTWSKGSGPGTVTFASPASLSTTATFSLAGKYVLRLRGYDGQLATTDTVTVVVTSGSGGTTNAAPVVSAGPDLAVTMPNAASLQGSATDDGLPAGSTLTTTWSKGSGPGTVTFANPASAATTATFSAAGTYVLQLRGSDGTLVSTDSTTVTVSAAPVGGTNAAPVVSAGPDVAVTMPNAASLQGSVSDDGLPAGSTVTATWSKASGPGTVTWANKNAATTTATFSLAGTYVLRLRGFDGALAATDTVTVVVSAAGGSTGGTLDLRVAAKADDAEERTTTGAVALFDTDLEMSRDGTVPQVVGLRFRNVQIPQGATITRAWVQFAVDQKVATAAATLSISGEASDNAAAFTTAARGLSARPKTAAVSWTPAAWPTAGAAGVDQRSAELASVLQQIVSRPGWAGGRALALYVTGTGVRTAESFDGAATRAPVLHVEWTR
jgi:hypothetical protein